MASHLLILLLSQCCVLGEQEEEEHGWVEEPVNQDYMIGDVGEVGEYQEDQHLASPGGAGGEEQEEQEGERSGGGEVEGCGGAEASPRVVEAALYIHPHLWEEVDQLGGTKREGTTVDQFIRSQMEEVLRVVNKHLGALDNGGYKVVLNSTIQRLENSDVHVKTQYVDRLDGNVTKELDQANMLSIVFTFQEAVERMAGRHDVHLRLLAVYGPEVTSDIKASAEEHCICDIHWFGCVIAWGVKDPYHWAASAKLLTHEFGHSLGSTLHDDSFYPEDRAGELIMWSQVDVYAHVWSEQARRAIREHDMSCLVRISRGNTLPRENRKPCLLSKENLEHSGKNKKVGVDEVKEEKMKRSKQFLKTFITRLKKRKEI